MGTSRIAYYNHSFHGMRKLLYSLQCPQRIINEMHLSTHHAQKTTKKTVSLCTLAAHFFSTPKARMMGTGILSRSPPMSKFCSDLCVCAPHSLLETEHNSQKPSVQPHHLGCRRNARQIRSSGQSCYATMGARAKAQTCRWGPGWDEGVVLLTEASGDRVGQRWPE